MTRLRFPEYLDHLRRESRRFRDVLADVDPAAGVPTCPDWDASDLLWHLTEVQWFWSQVVLRRPEGPEGLTAPERPSRYADLLALFDTCSAELVGALETADPAHEAWTWSAEQTVGFIYRRQAHEALIHRLDAELTAAAAGATAGQTARPTAGPTPLDPVLASDGIDELLDVMLGGCPPWGRFTPDGTLVRVSATDTGTELLVALGRFTGTDPDGVSYDEDDLSVVERGSPADPRADPGADPGPVAALVSGTAGDLDAWLWDRIGPEAVTVSGDPEACDRFRALAGQSLL
ncbi:maleylpyruvate isomerase N-terminal domain-containing protein [Nocardioides donggukensis]|uniref:Maleylpyruvate isomerase N-terminal domain-containing protein n=1 Tax=Nocardioides donggukensis TaxID=2774019 RepID=A0A927K3R3_9ACTN|nr:maleylpyruvate isomerase N-terminal domain-containing protein [Nocardioides donggukensis]MBD8869256.1 maleylpyruvate isomerase N-terminal domain-containing protein [Nocardioides donggukensis]